MVGHGVARSLVIPGQSNLPAVPPQNRGSGSQTWVPELVEWDGLSFSLAHTSFEPCDRFLPFKGVVPGRKEEVNPVDGGRGGVTNGC